MRKNEKQELAELLRFTLDKVQPAKYLDMNVGDYFRIRKELTEWAVRLDKEARGSN